MGCMNDSLRIFKILVIALVLNHIVTFSEPQKTYTISVENLSYSPFYDTDNYGSYTGFSKDLFDLFAKKNNIKLNYQPMPVARLLKEFFNGNIDFKYPDSELWQKENRVNKNIFYSNNVVEFIDGIVMKVEYKNKDISFIKTLGTIRGFESGGYREKGIRINESSNIPELIDKLYQNKVDAVYFNVVVALHYINHNEQFKNKFMFKKEFPHSKEFYKLSTMKHKDVIEKFNLFLKRNEKEIKKLKQKHGIAF